MLSELEPGVNLVGNGLHWRFVLRQPVTLTDHASPLFLMSTAFT
jgi:hypothetical protein